MQIATIHEAKTNLSKLIEQAERGEEIIIARGNEPVVRLVPVKPAPKKRPFGLYQGEFEVGPEFFEPLPDDELEWPGRVVRLRLDTHALLVWFALEVRRMSMTARDAIESLENDVFVSAASAWELTTKVRIGKLPVAERFAVEFRERIRTLGFQELAVSVEHGQRAGLMAGVHKDPFDRMLIAQALSENLEMVIYEEVFDEYRVRRIW